MSTLFMETTRINAERTVSEIQEALMRHNAHQVLLEYENRQIVAVSFRIIVKGQSIPFRLPCRWQQLEALLRQNGKRPRSDDTWESWARRVAWRQILHWVEAQLALVETGMVKTEEVFLPYMQNKQGITIFEQIEANHFALPEHAEER